MIPLPPLPDDSLLSELDGEDVPAVPAPPSFRESLLGGSISPVKGKRVEASGISEIYVRPPAINEMMDNVRNYTFDAPQTTELVANSKHLAPLEDTSAYESPTRKQLKPELFLAIEDPPELGSRSLEYVSDVSHSTSSGDEEGSHSSVISEIAAPQDDEDDDGIPPLPPDDDDADEKVAEGAVDVIEGIDGEKRMDGDAAIYERLYRSLVSEGFEHFAGSEEEDSVLMKSLDLANSSSASQGKKQRRREDLLGGDTPEKSVAAAAVDMSLLDELDLSEEVEVVDLDANSGKDQLSNDSEKRSASYLEPIAQQDAHPSVVSEPMSAVAGSPLRQVVTGTVSVAPPKSQMEEAQPAPDAGPSIVVQLEPTVFEVASRAAAAAELQSPPIGPPPGNQRKATKIDSVGSAPMGLPVTEAKEDSEEANATEDEDDARREAAARARSKSPSSQQPRSPATTARSANRFAVEELQESPRDAREPASSMSRSLGSLGKFRTMFEQEHSAAAPSSSSSAAAGSNKLRQNIERYKVLLSGKASQDVKIRVAEAGYLRRQQSVR